MSLILVFCFGTILGSFYALCIERIAKEESVIYPGSYCRKCNNALVYYDMIPIFSFINLKGKCRYCNESIGIQNILIEVLTGIIFIILFIYFGFSIIFIKHVFLFSILIISAFIDYNTKYVFSNVSLVGIGGGCIFLIVDILNGEKLSSIILSIIIPMALLLSIMVFTKKREGIGNGDLEIFFLLALYLNLQSMILVMYLSIILVTLVEGIKRFLGYKDKYVAFVPYITVATFITVFFYNNILDYYISLIIF